MPILNQFRKNEDGVTVVEYALLASLIAIFILTAVQHLGGSVSAVFAEVGNVLK